jgi:hypothetical protein
MEVILVIGGILWCATSIYQATVAKKFKDELWKRTVLQDSEEIIKYNLSAMSLDEIIESYDKPDTFGDKLTMIAKHPKEVYNSMRSIPKDAPLKDRIVAKLIIWLAPRVDYIYQRGGDK